LGAATEIEKERNRVLEIFYTELGVPDCGVLRPIFYTAFGGGFHPA